MAALAKALQETLSPHAKERKAAEDFLRGLEGQKNFATVLLQLVDRQDGDLTVRVAGAVAFKNFVKRNWKVVRAEKAPVVVANVLSRCRLVSRASPK